MRGTIAPTDVDWYRFLLSQGPVGEVNFWRPSASRAFVAPRFSPFLFKLKAPHNAICGFGLFARYSALPYWLAWDAFGTSNGCPSQHEMLERIETIRRRMGFRGVAPADHIGCIILVSVALFQQDDWIRQPSNWPPRNLTPMGYDLAEGEGERVWQECLERVPASTIREADQGRASTTGARFGTPRTVIARLGQGAFRIDVTEAYGRACAMTDEHSLPVLDAAHIRPYASEGPHTVNNGLLLRADIHRLFDKGYITVDPELTIQVSQRLKTDYANGKTYYPLHGRKLRVPTATTDHPLTDFLRWHNERFR
jgi:putative restriction endonuclease